MRLGNKNKKKDVGKMSEQSIHNKLNVSRLPSPPSVAVQILDLVQDPTASLEDMGRIIELDPALSAQVLRICNSAAYRRGRDVTSLPQAVTVLGSKAVSVIALGFSLKEAIPNLEHSSGLTDTDFWRQNVATAVTARSLARLAGVRDVDGAFLAGLLSRIGQLLLFSVMPDEYGKVLEAADGRLPTCEQEEEHLGFTHQEAGGLLLERWELPTLFSHVVRHWGTETQSEDMKTEMVSSIVFVSDAIARMLYAVDKANPLTTIYATSVEKLGLSSGEVDRMILSCGEQMTETMDVFNIPVNECLNCEAILEEARQQLVNVSLGLAADLTQAKVCTYSLREKNEELAKASVSDALTGLNNRAGLDQALAEMQSARATAKQTLPYSIIMVDLDKFKSINDTYGHSAGDDVLRSVGKSLSDCARATDFVARYGGEEFAVVLTNAGKTEGKVVAERFRASIQRKPIELKDRVLEVTASVGVASSDSFEPGVHFQTVLDAADAALYKAKREGRNRVVAHTAETPASV